MRQTTSDAVAAVIPVHNKERFVARAIASVLAQTTPVDEIIVVDDASTDGSIEAIEPFLDPRFKLLRRDRPGPGGYAARNLAIDAAGSRWIAFLDADDAWQPHHIAEIKSLIAQASDRTGCVFAGFETVRPDRPAARDAYSARHAADGARPLDLDGFLSAWVDLGASPIWTSAAAFRRDVLLKAGPFPELRCRRGGDKDMWLRAMVQADAVSSPCVSATYFKATQNQVTLLEGTNIRPCICATLEEMIVGAAGRRQQLLMRLFNREIVLYARHLAQRERLSPSIHRGFFAALNPLQYLMLQALSRVPLSLQRLARSWIVRSGSIARRLARPSAV